MDVLLRDTQLIRDLRRGLRGREGRDEKVPIARAPASDGPQSEIEPASEFGALGERLMADVDRSHATPYLTSFLVV
jgi:hypothetical protein